MAQCEKLVRANSIMLAFSAVSSGNASPAARNSARLARSWKERAIVTGGGGQHCRPAPTRGVNGRAVEGRIGGIPEFQNRRQLVPGFPCEKMRQLRRRAGCAIGDVCEFGAGLVGEAKRALLHGDDIARVTDKSVRCHNASKCVASGYADHLLRAWRRHCERYAMAGRRSVSRQTLTAGLTLSCRRAATVPTRHAAPKEMGLAFPSADSESGSRSETISTRFRASGWIVSTRSRGGSYFFAFLAG